MHLIKKWQHAACQEKNKCNHYLSYFLLVLRQKISDQEFFLTLYYIVLCCLLSSWQNNLPIFEIFLKPGIFSTHINKTIKSYSLFFNFRKIKSPLLNVQFCLACIVSLSLNSLSIFQLEVVHDGISETLPIMHFSIFQIY